VLVHGGNPGGIDDPRVRRLAEAFCRVGRTVLAPSLVLAERRMDADDGLRILDAIDELADRTGPVVVVAFSYGGALALCALAQRPSIQARVRSLATVGTYYDVVHLIEGATTGNVCVNGSLHPWQPPAPALGQVGPLLADFLGGRKLEVVEEILANRDPRRTAPLVAQLPDDVRSMLDAISPAKHITTIRVPLLALHSRLDPAAPAIESAQLVAAVRRRARARLTLVGSLRHVTPVGTLLGWVRDAPGLVRFAASILRAQERWA
jgi:pimeloyl-ACP methyl ester carboxylesterase